MAAEGVAVAAWGVPVLVVVVLAGLWLRQWLHARAEAARLGAELAAGQHFSCIFDALPEAVYVREEGGRILHANPACARLFGQDSAGAMRGQSILRYVTNASEPDLSAENARVFVAGADAAPQELTIACGEGRSFPAEQRLSRCAVPGGYGVLVQLRDISARKQHERMLVQHVTIDEVTRLPNRRLLMDRLRQAIALGRRGGGAFAVMLIDLDHFKRINETRGHTLGDALLASAAQRLRETVREADTVARFGGDEFVVILAEPDPAVAPLRVEYAAQRLIQAFQLPFECEGLQIVTTASVGIAVWPEDGEDPDTLMRNADTAMYEVKKSNRNGFCLFNREMNQRVQDSLRIDAHLRQALDRREFRVLFQPIVDASSRRVMKVEALLRWHCEELGTVPPDQFIPVAEETGQIVEIGAWVLEESCRHARALQQMRGDETPLSLSVNVSARQLRDANFAAIVEEVLVRSGLAPELLELELTERILIDDDPHVMANIAALRNRGISLSLDDFGTGYSSLSYLTRFPLNTVKLDRSFVRDIESNVQSLQLATAIIAMCRSLGLALVAEGVESGNQADLLRHRGCRFLQGYHFSRPVRPQELMQIAGFQQEGPEVNGAWVADAA